MSRALFQCPTCRHTVLDIFASLAGITLPRRTLPSTPRITRSHTITNASRPFSALRPLHSSSTNLQTNEPLNTTPSNASQTNHHPSQSNPSVPTVPWYLQVQLPTQPTTTNAPSPLSHFQDLPPLPDNSPPILPSILTHLNTQIGLDSLSILDLRDLDPPAALGSNLIMIIGTARSVKHLNVSADRFCRWLRTTYKLHPYADGLLGRNELKLKLRRRARKMKLAQSVGNTVAMRQDDLDITTGWICVNVGPVDVDEGLVKRQGPSEMGEGTSDGSRDGRRSMATEARDEFGAEELEEDEEEEYKNPSSPASSPSSLSSFGNQNTPSPGDGYVGFGSQSSAPRIVVQMFTEEKRAEMDLEGLWDVRIQRRMKKLSRLDKEVGSAELQRDLEEEDARQDVRTV